MLLLSTLTTLLTLLLICMFISVFLFVCVQDVAIHYRCGDNVHSTGMGLMRFSTIRALIAERDAEAAAAQHQEQHQYVYVLSEDGNRKTVRSEKSFCSLVLLALHRYLAESFPNKTIATLRGARIFDDMTRMALAATMIASCSSFSLYPAMINSNRAYFPAMPKHKHGLFSNQQARSIRLKA